MGSQYSTQEIRDFSGGLDLVTPLIDMPPERTPNAYNYRIGPGGLERVKGTSNVIATIGGAGATKFGTALVGLGFLEIGNAAPLIVTATNGFGPAHQVYTSTIAGAATARGAITDTVGGATLSGYLSLNPYRGSTMLVDSGSDLMSVNSAGTLSTADGSFQGLTLGVWRGSVWRATCTPSIAYPNGTIRWNAPNNLTSWATTNTVTLTPPPGGTGAPNGGAVVDDRLYIMFDNCVMMIHDNVSGANTIVDPTIGTVNWGAHAVVNGNLWGVDRLGVWRLGPNGCQIVSGPIEPWFRESVTNGGLDSTAKVTCCAYGDSFLFAMTTGTTRRLIEARENPDGSVSFMPMSTDVYCAKYMAVTRDNYVAGDNKPAFYFVDDDGSDKFILKGFTGNTSFDVSDESTDVYASLYETAPFWMGGGADYKRPFNLRVGGYGPLSYAARYDMSTSANSPTALVATMDDSAVTTFDTVRLGGTRNRCISFLLSDAGAGSTYSHTFGSVSPTKSKGGSGIGSVEVQFINLGVTDVS